MLDTGATLGVSEGGDSGPRLRRCGFLHPSRRLERAAVVASLSLLSAVLDQSTRLEDRARRDAAGLMRALESVTDPRKRRGRRFELVVVLALAVLAVCCGASSFAVVAETVADLERRLLVGFGLGCRRPPSAATFRRVLNVVDLESPADSGLQTLRPTTLRAADSGTRCGPRAASGSRVLNGCVSDCSAVRSTAQCRLRPSFGSGRP